MGLFDKLQNVSGEDGKNAALKYIAEKSGGEIRIGKRGSEIYFSKQQLSLDVSVRPAEKIKDTYSVQIIFIADHKYFDAPLVESAAGIGETQIKAIMNCTENFYMSTLVNILAALDCTGSEYIETTLMGKLHRFHMPCKRNIASNGKGGPKGNMWELVKDIIPDYLGTKKAYWIKLYASCFGGEPSCEVRINGRVYREITQKLVEYAAGWDKNDQDHFEKEFLLLIQDHSTYEVCPYTADEAIDLAIKAIDKIKMIRDVRMHEAVKNEITAMAPDPWLAADIWTFVPEILCMRLLGTEENDTVTAIFDVSNKKAVIRKSQLRSYGYIEEAVRRYLGKTMITPEEFAFISVMSSAAAACRDAVKNGADPNNLVCGELAYGVDNDYIVW